MQTSGRNNKKVHLSMIGIDGNAFAIMAAFRRQAKRDGWSDAHIKAVLDKAMDGDYEHLLATIMDNCVNDGGGLDEEESTTGAEMGDD